MAKYNCSTFGEYANLLKKDIKAALRGNMRVQCDEEENECGYIEIEASEDECHAIILRSVDEIVLRAFDEMNRVKKAELIDETTGEPFTLVIDCIKNVEKCIDAYELEEPLEKEPEEKLVELVEKTIPILQKLVDQYEKEGKSGQSK